MEKGSIDEKLEVAAEESGNLFSAEEDRRITRKLDFHILPWIFALWLLAFIDRSNIGTLHPSSSSALRLTSILFRQRQTRRAHQRPQPHRERIQHRPHRLLHPLCPPRHPLELAAQVRRWRALSASPRNRLGDSRNMHRRSEELWRADSVSASPGSLRGRHVRRDNLVPVDVL